MFFKEHTNMLQSYPFVFFSFLESYNKFTLIISILLKEITFSINFIFYESFCINVLVSVKESSSNANNYFLTTYLIVLNIFF